MSELQQIQRDRAYFKFFLTGLPKPINTKSLTGPEQFGLRQILNQRDALLKEFDKNSKELGLRVPEHRCYNDGCRNKPINEVSYNGETVWFCKKHFIEYYNKYL